MAGKIVADGEAERNVNPVELTAAEILHAHLLQAELDASPPETPDPGLWDPVPAGGVWSASKAITEEDGMAHETNDGKRHPITKPVTLQVRFPCGGGRRATRFVAEFFEQAGHPSLALETAKAVAELLNQGEELRLLRDLERDIRVGHDPYSAIVREDLASLDRHRDGAKPHRCADSAPVGYLESGHRQPGDLWTCPDCGKKFEYVIDEAEGSAWWPTGGNREDV